MPACFLTFSSLLTCPWLALPFLPGELQTGSLWGAGAGWRGDFTPGNGGFPSTTKDPSPPTAEDLGGVMETGCSGADACRLGAGRDPCEVGLQQGKEGGCWAREQGACVHVCANHSTCEHMGKCVARCLLHECARTCVHMCIYMGVGFGVLGHASTCLHVDRRLCFYIPGRGYPHTRFMCLCMCLYDHMHLYLCVIMSRYVCGSVGPCTRVCAYPTCEHLHACMHCSVCLGYGSQGQEWVSPVGQPSAACLPSPPPPAARAPAAAHRNRTRRGSRS